MSIFSNTVKALKLLLEEVIPFPFYVVRKRRKLREAGSDSLLEHQSYKSFKKLSEEQLNKRLEEERNRAVAMDEKTFKMTLSLSVGMTILGSVAAFLVKEVSLPISQIVLTVTIGISLLYILFAGFIAVGALKTLPSYGYGTQPLLLAKAKRQEKLAEYLLRQETINIVRQLRNETSYQALRNGLLLLIVSIAVFAGSLAMEAAARESAHSVDGTESLFGNLQPCSVPNPCQTLDKKQ